MAGPARFQVGSTNDGSSMGVRLIRVLALLKLTNKQGEKFQRNGGFLIAR